jgi:hypothetical protein
MKNTGTLPRVKDCVPVYGGRGAADPETGQPEFDNTTYT